MTILEEINEVKKEEVALLKREFTLSRFSDSEFFNSPSISFYDSLNNNDRISIIAEIKKASPSKGIIKADFNHLEIAETYMKNEVEAISILTDKNFFQGHISYLNDIAGIKSVPLVRKDFIIDEYQIYEAKANGADAILLICESLSRNQICELTAAAHENNLDVLLELHHLNELTKINFSQNKIIGINNRDLKTFNVDLETTNVISEKVPEDILLVSESGIKSFENISYLKSINVNAILVGEHLMSSDNLDQSTKEIKQWCAIEN